MSNKLKIVVLASGRGSNLQSVIDACARNQIKAQIEAVISDKEGAYALQRAEEAGIKNFLIKKHKEESRLDYDKRLIEKIDTLNIELIVLAGFMRLLSADFIKKYDRKLINIHPSLLPAFTGLNAQKQAFDYGVKVAGCTVHFVDEGCDTGPIILQDTIKVTEDDSEESLAARILEKEHQLLPKAIDLIAQKKVFLNGRKVTLKSS